MIHFHTDGLHLPVTRRFASVCSVTTLHGRLDIPGLEGLYQEGRIAPEKGVERAIAIAQRNSTEDRGQDR